MGPPLNAEATSALLVSRLGDVRVRAGRHGWPDGREMTGAWWPGGDIAFLLDVVESARQSLEWAICEGPRHPKDCLCMPCRGARAFLASLAPAGAAVSGQERLGVGL